MSLLPLELAIDKLRDEMAGNATHEGLAMIGEYMTELVTEAAGNPEKVLQEGKTLKGAFEAIHAYAGKHKTGNFAFVPPEKAYALVHEYYGIPLKNHGEPERKQALKADELDLDALLGL